MRETAMRSAIGTVLQRREKMQKQRHMRRRQIYQRKVILCAILFLLTVNAGGIMMVNAFADESETVALEPCYTSVRIREGDSLWSIAAQYSPESPMDITEYIQELKRMNRLTDDIIHAGHYLTIVYYK